MIKRKILDNRPGLRGHWSILVPLENALLQVIVDREFAGVMDDVSIGNCRFGVPFLFGGHKWV